jgi:hypothetical protein
MVPSGAVFIFIPAELVDETVGPHSWREPHIDYVLSVLGEYVAGWFSKR